MELLIALVFIIGYLIITLEHNFKINKTATALVTGVVCWTIYMLSGMADPTVVNHNLLEHISDISGILFFLLAAMTIVELIDAHDGFDIITSAIHTRNKVKLLWMIGFITFFLSAILDNLTTTIVMVSLMRKLIENKNDRFIYIGIVVIAANAGGAWTPIGDVTTTMLWIGGQVTSLNIMKELFLPSLVCLVVPLVSLMPKLKGELPFKEEKTQNFNTSLAERRLVFYAGLSALIFVPIFKTLTHLPPFMGILLALGILWIVIEIVHRKKDEEIKDVYSVQRALQRIDVPSVLFFLGILVAIAALESTGMLSDLANWMNQEIGNLNLIVIAIGLLSAIVDNVPLVAASMGMYDLSVYPTDHYLWEFLAYCAGTGGSILIIGSAAGVAAMGMEKIDFFNYFKKISFYALIGYFAGAFVYILMHDLH
jgi:Na+/H+ antiporter NhaD/arsenite permease-like protein